MKKILTLFSDYFIPFVQYEDVKYQVGNNHKSNVHKLFSIRLKLFTMISINIE